MGHAAVLTQCRSLTDEVFVVAAEALSSMTTVQEAAQGRLFPAFQTIRAISKVSVAPCVTLYAFALRWGRALCEQ